MERIDSQDELIKRYLLGELSAAERNALEDEYFGDKSKYDRLRKVEDELLDRYARGALSEADHERFERSYLTNPRRRRHAMFAKALARIVDEEMAARSTAPQTAGRERIERAGAGISQPSQFARLYRGPRFTLGLALAIASLLFCLGGAWFLIETSRLRAQLTEAQREGEAQRLAAQTQARQIADLEAQYKRLAEERERLQSELQAAKENASPAPHAGTVIFALSIRAFRDSGGQEPRPMVIPGGAEEARLRINLAEHEFPSYQVMLLTTDGRVVFARKGLRPQATRDGNVLIVSVPARKFASGDNVLSLSGVSGANQVETLGKAIVKVKRQ